MPGRIATVTGTMLTPGVSRNGRLYTKELISKAAGRMAERIANPDGLPIVMRTHHEAGDDSVRIVGRLTGVKVGDDGAATYEADLYDTAHGRDIAALVVPGKGQQPALKSVSIHGYWLGPVKRTQFEGEAVTTADDMEIDAVDFTGTPGVLGATVSSASWVRPGGADESAAGRTPISESVEATVEAVTEEAPVGEYSAKQKQAMLAAGQAMKNPSGDASYPIKTKSDLRKAIRAVGRGNADHSAIRRHIMQRAAALGLSSMIPDNWNKDGSMKESATRYSDIREYYDGPGGAAGFCIDAYNGPTSLTIRNCQIDPQDLRVVAKAAMDAVVNALQCLDPDMDADVDVPGADAEDTDGDMGTGESGASPDDEMETASRPAQTLGDQRAAPGPPAAAGENFPVQRPPATETASPSVGAATTTTEEEAAMGEPTTETAEPAAPARSLTDTDIAALGALFGSALKESLAPVTAALAEKAPAPQPEQETAETAPVAPVPAPVAEQEPTAKVGKKALKESVQEAAAALQADFDRKLTEALARQRDELRAQMLREFGLPDRRGYRVHENDQTGATEPSGEDLFKDRAEILLGAFGLAQPAQ